MVKTTKGGYGKHIIITHNMGGQVYESVYAHLKTFNVKTGQTVKQGQQIGVMGNTGIGTGIHLHFELHRGQYQYANGNYPTSFDPWPWINQDHFKMGVSTIGISLIQKWEGFYVAAYLCPAKIWTIGYGLTKWPNGTPVKQGEKITKAEALILLKQQVK
ncbi:M23 family metallopeptidase [Solibacillus isronensis]|uniref:M23 family metallopeptidase n=1 Tax=Solibacillus isronensis TaxID=412383 RepID=UPI00111751C5|nr:M23 family metallopeptidase [Solibacillus isronensis]